MKKKKVILYTVGGLFAMGVVITIATPEYEATQSYTTPAIESKDATYSESFEKTVSLTQSEQFTGEVLTCGDDLPNQDLTMSIDNANNGTSIIYLQNVGDGEMDGKSISNGETFTCSDGKQVRLYNDSADFTFTGEKEQLTPAVESTPAVTTVEKVTQKGDTETCYIDDEEVKCKDLKNLDDLESDIESQKK